VLKVKPREKFDFLPEKFLRITSTKEKYIIEAIISKERNKMVNEKKKEKRNYFFVRVSNQITFN
jgi:hypothetical protein